jgi:hypothetical protein
MTLFKILFLSYPSNFAGVIQVSTCSAAKSTDIDIPEVTNYIER